MTDKATLIQAIRTECLGERHPIHEPCIAVRMEVSEEPVPFPTAVVYEARATVGACFSVQLGDEQARQVAPEFIAQKLADVAYGDIRQGIRDMFPDLHECLVYAPEPASRLKTKIEKLLARMDPSAP